MALLSLHTENFRNLASQRLDFASRFNFVVGANGSGKSSLLEAICYLSSGKSFRTHRYEAVVRQGAGGLTVFGVVGDMEGTDGEVLSEHRLGISRDLKGGSTLLKVDGDRVRSLSMLARLLPVLVIDPGSFEIISGGPGRRRQYLDWITFHVEHGFSAMWQRLRRVTAQRNQLLRSGRIDRLLMRSWNERYVAASEELTAGRRRCFEQLAPLILETVASAGPDWGANLQIDFFQGWESGRGLGEVLEAHQEQEYKAGHSLYGPHRADLRLRIDGGSARDLLSRGQQKTLVILMKLAQAQLLHRAGTSRSTFLVDDIHAELDQQNRQGLLGRLEALGSQVFITGIEETDIVDMQTMTHSESSLFHVEQGRFRELQHRARSV